MPPEESNYLVALRMDQQGDRLAMPPPAGKLGHWASQRNDR